MKHRWDSRDADSSGNGPPKRRSVRLLEKTASQLRNGQLCQGCLAITSLRLDPINGCDDGILLSRLLSEVLEEAMQGCKGCLFFCRQLIQFNHVSQLRALKSDPVAKRLVELSQLGSAKLGSAILNLRLLVEPWPKIRLEACEVPRSGTLMLNAGRRSTKSMVPEGTASFSSRFADEDLWKDWGGSCEQIPRLVTPDPTSDETLAIISLWMRKCSKHATCRPVVNQPLPTRVLELSPTLRHKLIEAHGLFGQYVILSHCWGSSNTMYTTTKDNLPTLRQQLDTGALSRNFQDAILFTLRLGFKYLWIDALCILQRDPVDWRRKHHSWETTTIARP